MKFIKMEYNCGTISSWNRRGDSPTSRITSTFNQNTQQQNTDNTKFLSNTPKFLDYISNSQLVNNIVYTIYIITPSASINTERIIATRFSPLKERKSFSCLERCVFMSFTSCSRRFFSSFG